MFNSIHLRPRLTKDLLKILALKITYPLQKLAIIPFTQIKLLRAQAESDPVRALRDISEIIKNLRQEL